MLEYNEFVQELIKMDNAEENYRLLYEMCPSAFEAPITSWQEMRERFKFAIPQESPTIVDMLLTEREFFPHSNIEVNCFKNKRFCPAFLHKMEFIKIVYVFTGSAYFYFNQKRYNLKQGQFCIVSPGIEQAVFSYHDDDVVINILLRSSTFTNAFSALLMEQNILSNYFWKMSYTKYSKQVLMFTNETDEILEKMVMKLYYEVNMEVQPSNLILKSYVMIFLGEVLRGQHETILTLAETDTEVYQIPIILQDIKRNLNSVTLKWLAQKWSMSENRMNHYLKSEIGYSFSYLLTDLRMRQAAIMLLKTNDSIERITEEVGINDLTYFYKNFKKRYGMTPQSYREHSGKKGFVLPL